MKIAWPLLAGVLLGGACSSSLVRPTIVGGVFVAYEGKWVYPPQGVHTSGRERWSHLISFQQDGTFVEQWCYLEEWRTSLRIVHGEGLVVALGTWDWQGPTLVARRTFVYRTAAYDPVEPDPVCAEPVIRVTVEKDDISVGGETLRAEGQLSAAELQVFANEAREGGEPCGGA